MPWCNRFRLVLALALMACAFALPATAHAGDADLETRANEALKLYRAGNYQQAGDLFAALSVDYPEHLVFLHNLGACHYYLRRPEQAISNLSAYLSRTDNLDAAERTRVEGWIAEMKTLQKERELAARAQPTEPVGPTTPSQPSQPQADQRPAKRSGSGSVLPIVLTTVAGVAIAGGATATYISRDKFSQVEKKYNPATESNGKAYAKLQFVGYGVGVAALATAIVLWTRDDTQESPQAKLEVTPTLGLVNGASLQMRF